MKKFTALLAAVCVASTMFFGVTAGAAGITKVKVGLSTDEGGLNDKSFNQAANEGVNKAKKEFGLDYTAIESKSKDDYSPNLQSLIDNGAGLVFAVGFQMEDAVKEIAKNNASTKVVLIDDVVASPNVESINFKANESSFLVGVIAGKMTKTNKIGFIGGKDMPLINSFEYGFYAGVKSVNPKAAADLLNRKNTIYADSFADTTKGYDAASKLYGNGCDVIYHAAGGVGMGLFQKAQELRKAGKNVWAIGVDLDQAVSVPKYSDVILTSALKRVDVGTYQAVKDVVNGKFKGGKTVVLGLKEGGVGIAPSSNKHTPKAVLDLEAKYEKAIVAGKIVVPTDKKTAQAFKVVAVK